MGKCIRNSNARWGSFESEVNLRSTEYGEQNCFDRQFGCSIIVTAHCNNTNGLRRLQMPSYLSCQYELGLIRLRHDLGWNKHLKAPSEYLERDTLCFSVNIYSVLRT